MKRLLVLALLLAGCAGYASPGEDISNGYGTALKFLHDDARGVGCWYVVSVNGSNSIACMPDSAYGYEAPE